MFRLRTLLPLVGLMLAGMAVAASPVPRLYINYSLKPSQADLLAYDLCILDPHAKVDLKPAHALDHVVLAYVSLVEVARNSPAAAAAAKRGVPAVGSNAEWASQVLDVTTSLWRDFILEDCAADAVAKGYDGLFLDTVDSLERPGLENKAGARRAVISALSTLHDRWPRLRLVLNRGFGLLPDVASLLSGVLVESVYQGFDPASKHFRPLSEADSQWLLGHIHRAQALGLTVYAVDYVSPLKALLAEETFRRLEALHCIPLITTPALNGQVLATPQILGKDAGR